MLGFKKKGEKVNVSPIMGAVGLAISCLTKTFAWSDPIFSATEDHL